MNHYDLKVNSDILMQIIKLDELFGCLMVITKYCRSIVYSSTNDDIINGQFMSHPLLCLSPTQQLCDIYKERA